MILFQGIFERFDSDRSGKIDSNELREALLSLGFAVSPVVLDLLVSKFDKSGGKSKAIEYDNFIEYVCFPYFLIFCDTLIKFSLFMKHCSYYFFLFANPGVVLRSR